MDEATTTPTATRSETDTKATELGSATKLQDPHGQSTISGPSVVAEEVPGAPKLSRRMLPYKTFAEYKNEATSFEAVWSTDYPSNPASSTIKRTGDALAPQTHRSMGKQSSEACVDLHDLTAQNCEAAQRTDKSRDKQASKAFVDLIDLTTQEDKISEKSKESEPEEALDIDADIEAIDRMRDW